MKTYTREQALVSFASRVLAGDTDDDGEGQMTAYSGLFLWRDQLYREEAEPEGEGHAFDTDPSEAFDDCVCEDETTTDCIAHAQAPEGCNDLTEEDAPFFRSKSAFKAADPVLEEQVDAILSSIPPCNEES
jgi:hypothetical protein